MGSMLGDRRRSQASAICVELARCARAIWFSTSPATLPAPRGNHGIKAIPLRSQYHHVVPFSVRKAITVLHRNDRDNSACSFDVLLGDVGQRDQANLAFVPQLSQVSTEASNETTGSGICS